jgi:hypothetical protein
METVGAGEVLVRVRMGKRKPKSAKTMRLCGSGTASYSQLRAFASFKIGHQYYLIFMHQ